MTSIVLIGGGHAHLYVIKKLLIQATKLYQVTLVSPSRYQYYSGMFSGYIEGLYSEEEIRIDLKKLCERAKITFIQHKAERLDPANNLVFLDNGDSIYYDLISFNIGSFTNTPANINDGMTIKPNHVLPKIVQSLKHSEHPVIVGGGASGIELSLSLQAYRNTRGQKHPVTLISQSQLLNQYSSKISKQMVRIISKKNIVLSCHTKVISIHDQTVKTSSGVHIPYTSLLWLTGPKASPIFKLSNLQTDEKGFLSVRDTLQSTSHSNIFGAGDCVTIKHYPKLAKNGLYAIRQAPLLWNNIINYLKQKPLEPFQPQKRFLAIISTGNKEGFLIYAPFASHGRWQWKLKQYIDQSFIRSYQALYLSKHDSSKRKI